MSAKQRFDEAFSPEPNTGCWLWLLSVGRDGYGRFADKRKSSGAHRASYRLNVGPIPKGMHVLHCCDQRTCVNPAHLFLGTHVENMADRQRKGRTASGERVHGARLSQADVVAVRAQIGRRTQSQIAEQFGVGASTIAMIACGRNWRHVNEAAS